VSAELHQFDEDNPDQYLSETRAKFEERKNKSKNEWFNQQRNNNSRANNASEERGNERKEEPTLQHGMVPRDQLSCSRCSKSPAFYRKNLSKGTHNTNRCKFCDTCDQRECRCSKQKENTKFSDELKAENAKLKKELALGRQEATRLAAAVVDESEAREP
jgi:hypothetical protein